MVEGPIAMHLIASSRAQLEMWYMGCQPLAGLWHADRIPPGMLRWRALRLRCRASDLKDVSLRNLRQREW